ncbi:unnamed protein product [Protopolystoma xenopodis]|uniref:Uncharacterized protein n=1 Tax=Protopolystoma xenopodis TaxID=117903 RepID=A0A448WRM3_9PLAT|nr:unnamed protein product [Protopolystoma xenopodis]
MPDIKIISNQPSLALEEAGPTALATSDLLAPEEVCPPRGELLKGNSEVTKTDKRRHRKKLMRQRAGRRTSKKPQTEDLLRRDKASAMNRIIRLAHKPGSKIRIVK